MNSNNGFREFGAGVDVDGSAPRTVQQRVLQALRSQILRGELTAGTRLMQNDIAATMKVSTTPVREALRQLETERLVRIDAHRGGVVRGLDKEELSELLRWRRYMEPEAVRQAVPISKQALSRALEIHSRMANADLTDSQFAVLNRDFHLTIYSSGRSRVLMSLMQILIDPVIPYVSRSLARLPGLRERSIAEHQLLLNALERRDADEAVRLQLDHIERPRSEWLAQGADGVEGRRP